MQKSRDAYKEMAEKQQQQMAERSKKLLEQAAMMAGMSPEEYKAQTEQQTQTTMDVDEDGEVSGMPQAPADYKPHAWFVDDPAGYA
jgi:hypothetical protein